MRAEARGLLGELRERRPDWGQVPLALARIDEEESARPRPPRRGGGSCSSRPSSRIAGRSSWACATSRGAIPAAMSSSSARPVWSARPWISSPGCPRGPDRPRPVRAASQVRPGRPRLPAAPRSSGRKAIRANSNDFQARLWLCQVLMQQGRARRRRGRAPRGDRRRQGRSRSPDHAGPVHGADPPAREGRARPSGTPRPTSPPTPLAVAQCCAMVGKAFELSEPDRAKILVRPGPRLVGQGPAGRRRTPTT